VPHLSLEPLALERRQSSIPYTLDDIVTLLLYVLRWLTDTLPRAEQTETYRARKIAMQEYVALLATNGYQSSDQSAPDRELDPVCEPGLNLL
jgi:hypothetical protein